MTSFTLSSILLTLIFCAAHSAMSVIHLSENQVKELLDWPLVYEATEQAFRSICENRVSEEQPIANQPARSFTRTLNGLGVLLSMPGYIGNYKLSQNTSKTFNSLGCKLVTSFSKNMNLTPPKPNIMANILVFDETTGALKAIVEGTEITTWRTAAASLVATQHLFYGRSGVGENSINAAIIGCGVQGRIHSIGLCTMYAIDTLYLWNRSMQRAQDTADELKQLRSQFKNPKLNIIVLDAVDERVRNADIIVTATFSSTPVLERRMIKDNVHINAVGAGENHHSELSIDIYNDSQTKIYVDNWGSARTELKNLNAPIVGEVGDIINGYSTSPSTGITIFQSMGMAVEDVAVAQAILEKYQQKTK